MRAAKAYTKFAAADLPCELLLVEPYHIGDGSILQTHTAMNLPLRRCKFVVHTDILSTSDQLKALLGSNGVWDLVDIDAQGAEEYILSGVLRWLSTRVRRLHVSTHSRRIHWQLPGRAGKGRLAGPSSLSHHVHGGPAELWFGAISYLRWPHQCIASFLAVDVNSFSTVHSQPRPVARLSSGLRFPARNAGLIGRMLADTFPNLMQSIRRRQVVNLCARPSSVHSEQKTPPPPSVDEESGTYVFVHCRGEEAAEEALQRQARRCCSVPSPFGHSAAAASAVAVAVAAVVVIVAAADAAAVAAVAGAVLVELLLVLLLLLLLLLLLRTALVLVMIVCYCCCWW